MVIPVTVVEPSDERYVKACQSFEFEPRRYHSVKDRLAKEDLDCAMIAPPNQLHLENLHGTRSHRSIYRADSFGC